MKAAASSDHRVPRTPKKTLKSKGGADQAIDLRGTVSRTPKKTLKNKGGAEQASDLRDTDQAETYQLQHPGPPLPPSASNRGSNHSAGALLAMGEVSRVVRGGGGGASGFR